MIRDVTVLEILFNVFQIRAVARSMCRHSEAQHHTVQQLCVSLGLVTHRSVHSLFYTVIYQTSVCLQEHRSYHQPMKSLHIWNNYQLISANLIASHEFDSYLDLWWSQGNLLWNRGLSPNLKNFVIMHPHLRFLSQVQCFFPQSSGHCSHWVNHSHLLQKVHKNIHFCCVHCWQKSVTLFYHWDERRRAY